MSTAYPPRFLRYIVSSQTERDAARGASMPPSFYGHFPTSFGLYYSKPGKDYLSQEFYLMDTNAENVMEQKQPLYAVMFHKGPGSFQITICSTAQHGTPPMSIVTNKVRYSSSATITLSGTQRDDARVEKLQYNGLRLNTHTFTLNGETFELREDRMKKPIVRRLVWLKAASSRNSHTFGVESTDSQAAADYETEVVATWTEGSVPNRHGQLATFRFSSPDIIQKLGDYWALVAVNSVLAACAQGGAIEGARSWNDEKRLEKGYYS